MDIESKWISNIDTLWMCIDKKQERQQLVRYPPANKQSWNK